LPVKEQWGTISCEGCRDRSLVYDCRVVSEKEEEEEGSCSRDECKVTGGEGKNVVQWRVLGDKSGKVSVMKLLKELDVEYRGLLVKSESVSDRDGGDGGEDVVGNEGGVIKENWEGDKSGDNSGGDVFTFFLGELWTGCPLLWTSRTSM
jgi:hypothetical protein